MEPIQGAVWHALNHYQYDDAIIMAERLCAEKSSSEEIFLLATCYYRSGDKWAAKEILEKKGYDSPEEHVTHIPHIAYTCKMHMVTCV